MNIQAQIKLVRRLKADLSKEQLRTTNQILLNDLAKQITGLDAVIATLTKTAQLLDTIDILWDFNA